MDAAKNMGLRTKVEIKVEASSLKILNAKLIKLDFRIKHGEGFKQRNIVIKVVFWENESHRCIE